MFSTLFATFGNRTSPRTVPLFANVTDVVFADRSAAMVVWELLSSCVAVAEIVPLFVTEFNEPPRSWIA